MDISELKGIAGNKPFHRHPWEIARGNIIVNLLHKAGEFPIGHIIDIGSGDGYIAGRLTASDITRSYSAIDTAMDSSLAASLQNALPNTRFFRSLHEASRQIPQADVILILDVLEHVPDENALLTDICSNLTLTPATKWIITVPAFQSLFSHHDTLLGHYRRYKLAQLMDVCKTNGLIVEKKGYFFFSLLVPRILIRLYEKFHRKKRTSTIQDWKRGNTLTALLVRLLWIDYKFSLIFNKIGINIPGLSCYCICHRLPS